MSKKWSKFLLALAGIGAAIGIGIAFFKKKQHTLDDNSEFSDDFEDEDFDLDSDLEPVTQRSYVSLNQETEGHPPRKKPHLNRTQKYKRNKRSSTVGTPFISISHTGCCSHLESLLHSYLHIRAISLLLRFFVHQYHILTIHKL